MGCGCNKGKKAGKTVYQFVLPAGESFSDEPGPEVVQINSRTREYTRLPAAQAARRKAGNKGTIRTVNKAPITK